MNDINYWNTYYKKNSLPSEPSPFSKFVLPFLKEGDDLIELGCGNGRDSIFFAKNKLNVVAYDQCQPEIELLSKEFKSLSAEFRSGDFTNLPDRQEGIVNIYSRFTLHSIDEESETRVLAWAERQLLSRGLFFIEVRSVGDELCGEGKQISSNEFITDHYRRFINFDQFIERIGNTSLKVLYAIKSKGLAVYGDNDPEIIRVILQKT